MWQLSYCPPAKGCVTCGKRHHSALHRNAPPPAKQFPAPSSNAVMAKKEVFLATAQVTILDVRGIAKTLRAMIDPGSQTSQVCKSAAERLKLPRSSEPYGFSLANGTIAKIEGTIKCPINNVSRDHSMNAELHIIEKIAYTTPSTTIGQAALLPITKGKQLADPNYWKPGKIEVLIGADLYPAILLDERVDSGTTMSIKTTLGWILMGPAASLQPPQKKICASIVQNFTKFWEFEDLPRNHKPILSPSELEVIKFTKTTTRRNEDGRLVVKMPLIPSDLVAAEAQYHHFCQKKSFHMPSEFKKGYRPYPTVETAMEDIYSFLENTEECQFSLDELKSRINGEYKIYSRTIPPTAEVWRRCPYCRIQNTEYI